MSGRAVSFRQAMSGHPSGVAVVTAFGGTGMPVGVTVASLVSHSLEPPTVTFNLGVGSSAHAPLLRADRLAIHLLAADEDDVAWRFAGPPARRFVEQRWHTVAGAPELAVGATVLRAAGRGSVTVGDHDIVVAEVDAAVVRDDRPPLLHHAGELIGLTQPAVASLPG